MKPHLMCFLRWADEIVEVNDLVVKAKKGVLNLGFFALYPRSNMLRLDISSVDFPFGELSFKLYESKYLLCFIGEIII